MFNKFDSAAQKFDADAKQNALSSKVNAIFEDKPFSKRYKFAAMAAKSFAVLCNLVSALSFAFLVGFLVDNSLNSFVPAKWSLVLSGVIGLSAAVAFELIKNAASANFFVGFYKYKNAAPTLIFSLILLSSVSIFSSFKGATLIPEATKADTTKLDFSSFETEKMQLLELIKTAQKQSTYKGILTKQGHAQIAELNAQIAELNTQRQKYEENFKAEKIAKEGEKNTISSYLGYFVLCSELIYFCAVAFYTYFLYQCFIENTIDGAGLDYLEQPNFTPPAPPAPPAIIQNIQNTPPAQIPNNQNNPPAPAKIGFIIGQNLQKNTVLEPENTDAIISKFGLGVCKNCGSKFHKNSFNHKFCSENCKLENFERVNGFKFKPTKKTK